MLCSPVVLREGGCGSLGWRWREERTVGIQSSFRCADGAEGILTLLSFSLLSSSISVCYTCSPLHHARTLTEGKGREGVGEGIKKKFLCKVSVLERKQDFIKILAEHQLVPISKALGESFPFTLRCFSFSELHMLSPKVRRFWPPRFIQLGRRFVFQKCSVRSSCTQKLQCPLKSLVGLGDQVASLQAG